jgi:hypothetical protein
MRISLGSMRISLGSMRISLNGITTTISYIYSFNITLTSMYVVAAKDSSIFKHCPKMY